MKDVVERNALMGEEENSFQRDRKVLDNLCVMIEIIERLKKNNMKGYLACLDIEKVYDTVDREVPCAILRHIGIAVEVVNIIMSMYEDRKAIYGLGELETG